jgi:hypothetical protein
MPHIAIDGFHSERCIKQITIHAEVDFSREFFNTGRTNEKLKEIQEKLDAVISEYFDVYESEWYSNHEWNLHMKNK